MEIEQTQRDQTGEGGEGVADGRTEGRESREVAAALVSSPRREVRREREQGGGGSFGFFAEEGCEPSTGEGREGEGSDRSGRWRREGRGGKRDAYLTVRMAVPGAGARRGRKEPVAKEI